MANPTPQEVQFLVQKALAEVYDATDELIRTIKTDDLPDKEYHLRKAQRLKGDIVKAASIEEPKLEGPNIHEC